MYSVNKLFLSFSFSFLSILYFFLYLFVIFLFLFLFFYRLFPVSSFDLLRSSILLYAPICPISAPPFHICAAAPSTYPFCCRPAVLMLSPSCISRRLFPPTMPPPTAPPATYLLPAFVHAYYSATCPPCHLLLSFFSHLPYMDMPTTDMSSPFLFSLLRRLLFILHRYTCTSNRRFSRAVPPYPLATDILPYSIPSPAFVLPLYCCL